MLTPAQINKLAEIKEKFNAVDIARNDLDQLLVKIREVGDDPDLALTNEQIINLISVYTAKRQALVDAVNELPTI